MSIQRAAAAGTSWTDIIFETTVEKLVNVFSAVRPANDQTRTAGEGHMIECEGEGERERRREGERTCVVVCAICEK